MTGIPSSTYSPPSKAVTEPVIFCVDDLADQIDLRCRHCGALGAGFDGEFCLQDTCRDCCPDGDHCSNTEGPRKLQIPALARIVRGVPRHWGRYLSNPRYIGPGAQEVIP